MSDNGAFKRRLDVVTTVIIALGLILAIYQAYEIRESIDAANESTNYSTWNSVAQQWLDMDAIFVEHPDLRKYIFEGVAEPTDQKELDRANAVANKVLDFMDNALTVERDERSKPVQSKWFRNMMKQNTWDNYFGEIFSKSPMICTAIKNRPTSYDVNTVSMAQSNCKNW